METVRGKQYFLDNNSHLPLSKSALEALVSFNDSLAAFGHPSAASKPARESQKVLENCREKIAALIGAESPNQIFFTHGSSESCAWGLEILKKLGKTYYISPFEHPSVRNIVEEWKNVRKLAIDNNGTILPVSNLDCAVVIYVQNEIGVIQDLSTIGRKYLFSDISQAIGKIPVNVNDLAIDIGVFGGHKFGGPTGIGCLYLKNPAHWIPWQNGSRYFLDSVGTPDVAGVFCMTAALEDAINTLPQRTQNMIEFQDILEKGLEELGVEIVGKGAKRSPNCTFGFLKDFGMKLVMDLSERGIYCGLSAACGSIFAGESKILKTMGKSSASNSDGFRISQFGQYDGNDAEKVLKVIRGMVI